MAQITINIQTLDWTMGETVGLHLMLKKDSKAGIAWGRWKGTGRDRQTGTEF